MTPEGVEKRVEKPSKIVKSPFGHPVVLKELVTLQLTPEKDNKKDNDADDNGARKYVHSRARF